ISIGNVYYCPGCQKIAVETITEQSFAPTEADFTASDAGDAEIKRGFAADKQVVVSEGIPSNSADTAADQSADTAADAAADAAEDTSATTAASNNAADIGVNAAADSAATTSANSITDAAEDIVPDSAADSDSEINAAAEATAASEANIAIDKKTVTVTKPYCPGHVDLYVNIYIKGIDDNDSLFKADPTGNSQQGFNTLWKGWTADKVAEAKSLCSRNWLESYGLTISSIKAADELTGELTKEDIDRYIYSIKDTVSDVRESIVRFALDSVGRVPYYWGGKPNCGGYEGNNFGSLVSADNKGRILKGLDCSGWINWVYWSATGNSLNGQGTGTLISCGTKIETSELRPGDIVIRTGEGSHAAMFLCWSENGNIIVVHESGGIVNNVEVSEMSSNWPYYISLID
ncbi:MAG: NlpC/P60 family protein, partial [Clostridiales bacterium]|nr:NlpC/P60 family protein [Clostridiales bacterium]